MNMYIYIYIQKIQLEEENWNLEIKRKVRCSFLPFVNTKGVNIF